MTGDRDCVSQTFAFRLRWFDLGPVESGPTITGRVTCETCQLTRDWHLEIDVRVSKHRLPTFTNHLHLN